MKKSNSYAPYLFAFLLPLFSAINNKLLFKSGIILVWIVYSVFLLGLWRLIEWLLNRTENKHKLVQWSCVLLGASVYCFACMSLDYSILHLVMAFSGFSPMDMVIKCFVIIATATIYIESVKWSKAREKAKIDNLKLQAENIEAKFQSLREQVNPEFLFYCLSNLRKMFQSNDPNTEGYVLKLADVYRQTLNKDKNIVSLKEELDLLKNYMFLMRYGREKAISFEVAVSEASLKKHLPIFALQVLGDNCVKHNVFSESQPLHIRIFQRDPLSITITNNYQRNEIPKSFGIDIEHLEMRYALEGIDNPILIEKGTTTYSTTLKLF
jgi:hypothetical protein